jgi:prolyl-tRNA synthetase
MSEPNTANTQTEEKKDQQVPQQEKKAPREKKEKAPKQEKPKDAKKDDKGGKKDDKGGKKEAKDLLGVGVKKDEDFSEWYTSTITKAEMIEYYDISGCYILRPWAYAIWESIQEFVNIEIKKLGIQNAYFPLLVSERALTAEKDHIEGFAPEVAWVTKAGQSALAEPVAIRPTSETIMYPAYSTWIRSHRDLPLKLNQWGSVVRWEFKHPVPFIRCREFLWQEGHTAFASKPEADEEVLQILDIYARVYSELLAMPCVKGRKSENEKFAGGLYTTTCETFIPANGRGLQGATSHCLGQNFAKMFHIEYEDDKGGKQLAWQNSWGLTIRVIGAMVMVHGDNKGLVMPPRVAPVQAVIIPLFFANKDNSGVEKVTKELLAALKAKGVRVTLDDRTNYNPGWKYNHWELKGVPVRIEVGPKDVETGNAVVARRDNGAKETVSQANVPDYVLTKLTEIQQALLERSTKERNEHMVKVTEWSKFVPTLDAKNTVLTPWCDRVECEKDVKKRSGEESKKDEENTGFRLTGAAKTLCIPFDQPELAEGTKCFACGELAKKWTLFGRSY